MAHPVRMPKPGQMTEACTITRWYKAEGDPVRRGDVLFEIETDKATMDVEAFDDGILLRRLFAEGDTVPVNTICAYVGAPGEAIPVEPEATAAVSPAPAQPPPPIAPPPGAASLPSSSPAESPAPAPSAGALSSPTPVSSSAAAQVATPVAAQAAGQAVAAAADRPPGSMLSATPLAGTAVGVSPRAARLAAAVGVDLARVVGTGPGRRIVQRDVLAAIAAGLATSAAVPTPSPAVSGTPGAAEPVLVGPPSSLVPGDRPVDEEAPRPLSRLRRTMVERLTSGWVTTPQFRVTVAADVTPLLDLRSELRSAGHDVSLTDFILAATAQTLVEFPDLNARTDGVLLWPRRRVHLGLVVAVSDGLLVPVLHDTDRCSLLEIHAVATRLVEAARTGGLGPDELSGSTFTVWDLGMLGVESFEAIVNPGEAAVLAVGSATPEVVAVGDGIGIRTVLRLTLSADHRIVDGALAARFLGALRRRLVDVPGWRVLLDRA